MKFNWIACFLAIALSVTSFAQSKDTKWLTDKILLDMMFSSEVPPPENLPLTPVQRRSSKALWARTAANQRRVVLKSMRYSYLRGPYNLHLLTDAELSRLLKRGLTAREQATLDGYLSHLSDGDKGLLKRMLLNCLTRTM